MTGTADLPETITYCERWSNTRCKPFEPLTPAEAQRRDQAKEFYTVVLGDPAAPRCYVEVAWENNYLGVWFLDEELRRSAHLSFTRLDDTRMFLDAVVLWHYSSRAGRSFSDASTIEKTSYKTNGFVRRTTTDVRKKRDKVEEFKDVPLDINWEPVPVFGNYTSVTRVDREES